MRQRDEDCFGHGGSALNEEEKKMIKEEFDFEKNLAMFDKSTVMAEIDAELGAQPDIVRLVHCNRLVAGQGGHSYQACVAGGSQSQSIGMMRTCWLV